MSDSGQFKEDLKTKLQTWLNKNGYPLEMVVAKAFTNGRMFGVFQGEYYTDEQTKTAREIDVVARSVRTITDGDKSLSVRLTVVVECKASSNPWVLFTNKTWGMSIENSVKRRVFNMLGGELLQAAAPDPRAQKIQLLSQISRRGYSLVSAKIGTNDENTDDKGKDQAFAAVMKVLGASKYFAQQSEKESEWMSRVCEIIFPVIVTKGPLFECYLDEKNETVLNKIERGVLVHRHSTDGGSDTIINIITADEVNKFVEDAKEAAVFFLHTQEAVASKIIEEDHGPVMVLGPDPD